MSRVLLPIAISMLFIGCAQSMDPKIDFKAPEYVQQMPSREDEQTSSLGSLFGRGDNPLFADRKAMNINDVVTVMIDERASSSSSANRQLNKAQDSQMGPGVFTYGGNSTKGAKLASNLNNVAGFGFSASSDSTFNGGGTATRAENFTTTVSARIVKIMQNGNYFIEGRREILVEDEKQIIQISGVIRPYDITQNNTISSAYVSDAKISYRTEGDIKRNTKQGWGTRLIEAVNPF
ncbi:flagellar L-ring protein [Campylobacterota bacterium]|nr:flagellar L-ring protein [Campylobacterota bacterium]